MSLLHLRAGTANFAFDPDLGMLRYLRVGGVEILRGVYVAVRNEHWGTFPHEIELEGEAPNRLRWRDSSGPMQWTGEVTWGEGWLRYQVDGEATETFATNRTGLCLLHPASVRGAVCRVEHTDGTRSEGAFPHLILPDQPFFDIRAIEHEAGGVTTRVEFEGEVFEMEDQRNWTDASFKTYCRPQEWPKPYTIEAGDSVRHAVTVRWSGTPTVAGAPEVVRVEILDEVVPMPKLGALVDSPLWTKGSHLMGWISSGSELLVEELGHLAEGASAELELLTVGMEPSEIEELERHRMIARLLVPDSGVRDELKGWNLRGELWAASTDNFTELNRDRPKLSGLSGVAFATYAQVHAFDDLSIAETLEGLEHVLESARTIAGELPIRVGPIRLAASKEDDRPLFTPWTLAAVGILAEAGVQGATFAHPEPLDAILSETEVRKTRSSDPLRVRALALKNRVLLLNLWPEPVEVEFADERRTLPPHRVLEVRA
jgi:hypothetical protein